MHVGSRIVKLLTAQKITAYRLAQDIYVSQSAVSNWIHLVKKPNKSLTKLIAITYNISFDWLYYGKGKMNMKEEDDSHNPPPKCRKCPKIAAMVEKYSSLLSDIAKYQGAVYDQACLHDNVDNAE